MNIKNKLEAIKVKTNNYLEKRSQANNERQAKKLQKLRTKRLKYEGKARLVKFENNERERIARAERTIKNNSFVSKLKTGVNKAQARSKSTGKSYRKVASANRAAFVSSGNKGPVSSFNRDVLSGNVDRGISRDILKIL